MLSPCLKQDIEQI